MLVTERHAAERTLEAKQWSQVMKSGLSTRKLVPLANSSRTDLSRHWRPLVSLAMCGWTVYCADCLRPKRDSMHGAPSENWRAPVLVREVPGRIASVSALRTPGQMGRTVAPLPGKERAERVLASAISIDGRKEWTCKFCSESNVWTRSRCKRCYNDIPTGLRGKYRQAITARTGE